MGPHLRGDGGREGKAGHLIPKSQSLESNPDSCWLSHSSPLSLGPLICTRRITVSQRVVGKIQDVKVLLKPQNAVLAVFGWR